MGTMEVGIDGLVEGKQQGRRSEVSRHRTDLMECLEEVVAAHWMMSSSVDCIT
jgi:hypothetical protein